jgi:hypothetical protein
MTRTTTCTEAAAMKARSTIKKISDPRSRGVCYWFEIFGTSPDGTRWSAGSYDTKPEAIEALRQIRSAAQVAI